MSGQNKGHLLKLIIQKQDKNIFYIQIIEGQSSCILIFNSETKEIKCQEDNKVPSLISDNLGQLRKIFINKRKDTFYPGFELDFVIYTNKPLTTYKDRDKTFVLDRRFNDYSFQVKSHSIEKITEAYTDGSFSHKTMQGGYAVLIKSIDEDYEIFKSTTNEKKSSLIELQAAIKALELLNKYEKIRILTDSVYVIKGITEWLPIWKINNWLTCNGDKVKNIHFWKKTDALTKGKYIEFRWVKAHSQHFENTICDLYAKDMSKQQG